MKTRGAFALLLALLLPASLTAQAQVLRVCLEEDSPPYSYSSGAREGGFDLAVSEAVAEWLGRRLAVQWYESEFDEESTPAREVNALLSAGLCDAAAGYMLFAGQLGAPQSVKARLPEHQGGGRGLQPWVRLQPVVASRPYHFAPLTVVLGAEAGLGKVRRLTDLKGLALVSESGTVADLILMSYDNGSLVPQIAHLPPAADVFGPLEEGRYAAALVELHQFDAYRARHPDTGLTGSGYVHPLGFNMGFAALESSRDLLARIDEAIASLLSDARLQALAAEAGMSYLPPREPAVLSRIGPRLLRGG